VIVAGDPYQAIFGFTGASYTPLSGELKKVVRLPLSRSRRLTQEMADLALAIRKSNDPVHGTGLAKIVGEKKGGKPELVTARSQEHQAAEVVKRVQRLCESGVEPREIAILARLNEHLRPVEQALKAINLDTNRAGGKVAGIKHVQKVLRIVQEFEGLDEKELTAKRVRRTVSPDGPSSMGTRCLPAIRRALRSKSLEGKYHHCAAAYMQAHGGVRADKPVRAVLNAWEPRCRKYKLAVAMRRMLRRLAKNTKVITSTVHQAKGNEWKHVFVIGLTDGVMPDYRAMEPEKIGEELNLAFVAVTRASEHLTLLHAPQTILRPHRVPVRADKPSRFLIHEAVLRELSQTGMK
jgi:DNA helicase-2/ATP-dependent DNA helicase PcrA